MSPMRALVKNGRSTAVRSVPRPSIRADEVLVRVALAGVCRTDLYVVEGRVPSRIPSFSATSSPGSSMRSARRCGAEGRRPGRGEPGVRVRPVPRSAPPTRSTAPGRTMLGHRPGRGLRRVRGRAGAPCSRSRRTSPIQAAAYAEPVAAALGVLNAGLDPHSQGLSTARNRFAATGRTRSSATPGFDAHVGPRPGGRRSPVAGDAFDFAIETGLDGPSARRADPGDPAAGGTLVLKSRQPGRRASTSLPAIRKQLTFRAVQLRLIPPGPRSARRGPARPVGPARPDVHPLEQWQRGLLAAAGDE